MQDKRIAIYQAASVLLAQTIDARSITVSQIAAQAGVGKGTVYEYFSSKQEILLGTVQYTCICLLAAMERACADGSFADRLDRLMQVWQSAADDNQRLLRGVVMNWDTLMEDQVCRLTVQPADDFPARVAAALEPLREAGQREGLLRGAISREEWRFALLSVFQYLSLSQMSPCPGRRLTEVSTPGERRRFCSEQFVRLLC